MSIEQLAELYTHDCPDCHYPMCPTCKNPACPHDKQGEELNRILEAQEAWIAKLQMEDLWRRDYRRVFSGEGTHR